MCLFVLKIVKKSCPYIWKLFANFRTKWAILSKCWWDSRIILTPNYHVVMFRSAKSCWEKGTVIFMILSCCETDLLATKGVSHIYSCYPYCCRVRTAGHQAECRSCFEHQSDRNTHLLLLDQDKSLLFTEQCLHLNELTPLQLSSTYHWLSQSPKIGHPAKGKRN